MAEQRRTFHVGPRGATHPIVLHSVLPGFWWTPDNDLFQHVGHAWLGPKGRRYRIEKWLAPHTDRAFPSTFPSLQSALNAWWRARKAPQATETKTPAQLDAEIAEALGEESPR